MNDLMKIKVQNIYGDSIYCSEGVAETKIQLSVKREVLSDLAIYFNDKYSIAVIWDLKHRKECGGTAHTLSFHLSWNDIKSDNGMIFYEYKSFNTDNGFEYEKVIWVNYKDFDEVLPNIFEYLKFDVDDEFGNKVHYIKKKIYNSNYSWTNKKNRERVSTSTWKRNHDFRKRVLNAYGNQCAICRCCEEKILEAAHIIAVADGGTDDEKNGICLCRNHHKMFDEKLIGINFITLRLDYVHETVKNMAWYDDFKKQYKSKIIERDTLGGK